MDSMSLGFRGQSHRPVVMGRHGMVTSAHYLASLAGLRMLLQGGNAIDAVVATAAALNVCEPFMSGMGGLGYMIIRPAGVAKPVVLDYMGRSPKAAAVSAFATEEEKWHGAKSILTPGALAGWLAALETYGSLDRATVFAPALEYAAGGIPLSIRGHWFMRTALAAGHVDAGVREVWFPGDRVHEPGTIARQPKLAATFQAIVDGGRDAFYQGPVGEAIVRTIRDQGGLVTLDDLAEFEVEWQEPASARYRGHDIYCPAPPCSGVQYLQALSILDDFDLAALGQNSAATIHLMAEAFKLAIADRIAYAPTPDLSAAALLDPEYVASRRRLIDRERAGRSEGERYDQRVEHPDNVVAGQPRLAFAESTTHFDAIDAAGNAVAVTQSLGDAFGSGVMGGETGVVLNNFAYWFDLKSESANQIAPGKKIEMCMAPALVFEQDRLAMAIGTPGSFGILQTTPQMISNVIDHGFSIQAAIEAPRFRVYEGTTIEVEARLPKVTRDVLADRGHSIRLIDEWSPLVGGGQGIVVDRQSGALAGGADPRRDGYAIGW
jgi:gamma-glutamyltranspeptidase/glutathione hydrolase